MTTATTTTGAPQVAINDIGSEEDFLAAIDETIKYFNDGDIVEGTIVKVDRDEVLLDMCTVLTLAGLAGQHGAADGSGAFARFQTPAGLSRDPANTLIVADPGRSGLRLQHVAHRFRQFGRRIGQAADRQVLVVQQVGEKLFAIADGFVRLVHDAEVEGELRGARGLGECFAALIGGEDDGEPAVFSLQPGGDFLGIGEAGHAEVLAQDGAVIALDTASLELCSDFTRPEDLARPIRPVRPDVIVNAANTRLLTPLSIASLDGSHRRRPWVRKVSSMSLKLAAPPTASANAWVLTTNSENSMSFKAPMRLAN